MNTGVTGLTSGPDMAKARKPPVLDRFGRKLGLQEQAENFALQRQAFEMDALQAHVDTELSRLDKLRARVARPGVPFPAAPVASSSPTKRYVRRSCSNHSPAPPGTRPACATATRPW